MTHRTRRVAVIGAGLSGLVAIKELLDEGHQVDAFEAAGREGGVFASTTGVSYDQMRLTVSQHFMAFSSMTPPPDEPRAFWTRERYLIYLRAFCERFDLLRHIRFETRVTAIQRLPDGTMRVCWSTGGPGEAETQGARIYDAVAICQGAFRASAPRLPCIPGLADFPGRVTHSAAYVGPKPFAGRRVLVIGMGETAADVTSQIAAQAAHCWLTFRTYPELVARFPYGHAHTTDAWSARINHWLPHARLTEFRAATDLDAAYGPLPDRHRLVEDWAVRSGGARFLQKNDDFVPQVLSGEIDVAPGGVERIEGGVVHLADGRKVEPDDIVLCTGYRESSIPAEWLDGVQVDDVRGLFKQSFHPEFGDRVAFIGWARPRHGGVPACSEMIARYFALLCSGRRQLPEGEALRAAIERDRDRNNEEFQNSPELRTLVHFTRFMDEMAELIGCAPQLEDDLDDPAFLYHFVCGGVMPASYRLRGPHADPERARALIRALPVAYPPPIIRQRLKAALAGRAAPEVVAEVERRILRHLDSLESAAGAEAAR